jgi:hypothetical protein
MNAFDLSPASFCLSPILIRMRQRLSAFVGVFFAYNRVHSRSLCVLASLREIFVRVDSCPLAIFIRVHSRL